VPPPEQAPRATETRTAINGRCIETSSKMGQRQGRKSGVPHNHRPGASKKEGPVALKSLTQGQFDLVVTAI